MPRKVRGETLNHNRVVACCLLQEEALRAFVEPETLDGSNQYYCEKCARKCDAHKVRVLFVSLFSLTSYDKFLHGDHTRGWERSLRGPLLGLDGP